MYTVKVIFEDGERSEYIDVSEIRKGFPIPPGFCELVFVDTRRVLINLEKVKKIASVYETEENSEEFIDKIISYRTAEVKKDYLLEHLKPLLPWRDYEDLRLRLDEILFYFRKEANIKDGEEKEKS